MSDPISSSGNFLSSVGYMMASEQQLTKLSQELNTGTKSVSLAGYGTDAPTIVNLQSMIQQTQAWTANSDQINNYLSGYNTSLTDLSSDATELQNSISALSSGTGTSTELTSLQTLIKGLEADVGATLNGQVGNRYIFAGTRYGTAPVVDLTQLATPTTPTALTLASGSTTPPTIPDYDSDYASQTPPGQVTSGAAYYNSQQVNISNSVTLTFGISSSDPSIQQLVYALKQAEAGAASTNTATAQQFFTNAQAALSTAVPGLTTLTEQNAEAQNQISTEQAVQNQSIATMQDQLGSLTQVDAATVATQLTAVENQLSATYKSTTTLLNLSLLTYLGT